LRWWLFPLFGTAACLAYFLVPAGAWSDSVFVAVGTTSIAAIVVGIRTNRPTSVTPWVVIAVGSGLWVLGDFAFLVMSGGTGQPPTSSLPDVVYLLGYPALASGLYLLVHQYWRRGELGHVANSAIVMIAFGLLMWVFVVRPTTVDISTTQGLISAAYPAMDVYLLGLLVHLVGTTQWKSVAFRLLTAAIVLVLAADTATNIVTLSATPHVVDVGYLAYYVLVGTAALHPSMSTLTPLAPRSENSSVNASFSLPTIAVLTVSTLTVPVVMAVLLLKDVPVANWGWGVVVCATLLIGLVVARVVELLRLLDVQARSLRTVAHTDLLTGLPNRLGIEIWAEKEAGPLTFLLLDIDRFHDINDTLGHAIGDQVLQVVGGRLEKSVGSDGIVGRLGADEFAAVLRGEESRAREIALKMTSALSSPVSVRGARLLVEASIGIASHAAHGIDVLIQQANLAMRAAKIAQPRLASYEPSMDRDNREQLLLLSELTEAIEEERLEVYYQLQADLRSMTVVGVEALLRWNHPERGLLEPDLFIPMAERTGLVRPLFDFVLNEALSQRRGWYEQGVDLHMSVNISTRNLVDSGFVQQVQSALERAAALPETLTIEITEGTAMTDLPGAVAMLNDLRDLGITLAIDDYGTGYSSLAYVQQLPVQQLKIDKAFVRNMATVPAHRVIVRSTIELAISLGLTVTAEGVEDRETGRELSRMGCHYIQGYDLGRPIPASGIPDAVTAANAELAEFRSERELT
jgi:diguanylate cyclase (GGDEF)-like protein